MVVIAALPYAPAKRYGNLGLVTPHRLVEPSRRGKLQQPMDVIGHDDKRQRLRVTRNMPVVQSTYGAARGAKFRRGAGSGNGVRLV